MASQVYTFDGAEGTKVSSLPGIFVTPSVSDAFAVLDGTGGVKNLQRLADASTTTTTFTFDTQAQSQTISVTLGAGAIATMGLIPYLACVRLKPAGTGPDLSSGWSLGYEKSESGMWLHLFNGANKMNISGSWVPATLVVGDKLTLEAQTSADRKTIVLRGYVNDVLLVESTRTNNDANYSHSADRTGVGFRAVATDSTGTLFTHMTVGDLVLDTTALS